MPLNFNVDPYYDDFNPAKNYHRILFKPGYAVQGRELTQSQTILQNQITNFADNIFRQNSPVTGGNVTTNFNVYYVKLLTTYNNANIDVTLWNNKLVQNFNGSVIARVVAIASATGDQINAGDPPTLILSYKTGDQFVDGDVIYDVNSNLAVQAIPSGATGQAGVSSIDTGIFYVNGIFVQANPSTVIIGKYTVTPNVRVGLTITETIKDYIDDPSLLDPAIGASNYQAPGADRYYLSVDLDTRPLEFGDDELFIDLVRIENGQVYKLVDGSVYASIDDYFAKREFETNGDYVLNDFKLTPKSAADQDKYIMNVGKGVAYVRGYRVENPAPYDITTNRARTTDSVNNSPVYINFGSYFYVQNVQSYAVSFGKVDPGKVFDGTLQTINVDFHSVSVEAIDTRNYLTYNATKTGSGLLRGMKFDHFSDQAQANTYTYKMYVYDVQTNSISGTAEANPRSNINSILLPGTYPESYRFSNTANAYVGQTITLTGGTNQGETRTISQYESLPNGGNPNALKIAYVNPVWSVAPDATTTFTINHSIADTETVAVADINPFTLQAEIYSSALISPQGKVGGTPAGPTVLSNALTPEPIFPVGNPYVVSLQNASYPTSVTFRNVQFTPGGGFATGVTGATLGFSGTNKGILQFVGPIGEVLDDSTVAENFTIICIEPGTNTLFKAGDLIPWKQIDGSYVTLAGDGSPTQGSSALFSSNAFQPFTAVILSQAYVRNADNPTIVQRVKNLVTGNSNTIFAAAGSQVSGTRTWVDLRSAGQNSGQVFILNDGLAPGGEAQSLYLADVKSIKKIIDTKDPTPAFGAGQPGYPTLDMLTDPFYDITNNYILNNGQNDNFYDHASITLRSGASQPIGNILIVLDYYQHSGGDGYFSGQSYLNPYSTFPEDYKFIPSYTSKYGTLYYLRDCIDFRPSRLNGTTLFQYQYSGVGTNYGTLLATDATLFETDYTFYLGRKDKLILTKDRSLQIIQGIPALSPILPTEPDGALVIANLTLNPYTGFIPTELPPGYLSDLSIEKIQHRRYTMQDISGLEARINRVEYYSALNALEAAASGTQITDGYGLNRFKNGIMVDDFSSYNTVDTSSLDFSCNINRRTRQMTAQQDVKNFPLQNLDMVYSLNSLSPTVIDRLPYAIWKDGLVNYFSLKYSTINVISQKIASRTVNINPFSVSTSQGIVSMTPNVDNWVDTNYAPSLLIVDPNLQVFQQSNTINILKTGDWQTVSGTTFLSGQSFTEQTTTGAGVINHGAFNGPFGSVVGFQEHTTTATQTSTYTTVLNQQQNNILGPYSAINNTYNLNNGYITDISILPWMRRQDIATTGTGLLFTTKVSAYFDNQKVDAYFRKANIIELTESSGDWEAGDTIGYSGGGSFHVTGIVIGVYKYPNDSTRTRLYVAGDGNQPFYTPGPTIPLTNALFDNKGVFAGYTNGGVVSSVEWYGGSLKGPSPTITVRSNRLAIGNLAFSSSNTAFGNTAYVGNTFYLTGGTIPGQSATITGYDSIAKIITVDKPISYTNGDIYSIGGLKTNEEGNIFGIFCIPPNSFHTGDRVFRFDNRINNNIQTATTFAEGTFYASGLQVTSQQVDFGASPAGAKGTFVQTNQRNVSFTTQTTSVSQSTFFTPYDPLAQTFLVDPTNFPSGCYLKSARFFFQSKPTSDNSPVTLSIVGTLNGYPNGQTLDHSIVTLPPTKVKVSDKPQFLDDTTYTQFDFSVPVYIQPGILYAFILQSPSKEYNLWTALNGDTAIPSSTKNLPDDPDPPSNKVTKITTAPYVGGLFKSQNSQTWQVDQNQSLMFTVDRCVFNTSISPSIRFVVPRGLPGRKLLNQSVDYFSNTATGANSSVSYTSTTNLLADALNFTTTDLIPTGTSISYNYISTLKDGSFTAPKTITPGKYGTTMYDHIYLDDGLGERLVQANSNTSLSLESVLLSSSDAVSPFVSDAGLSAYVINYEINNCSLSNSLISITNAGQGYTNAANLLITVDNPTGKNGQLAVIKATCDSNANSSTYGNITSVYVATNGGGSGYITTPKITINTLDPRGSGNANVAVTITGETSKSGGPAIAKYVTKKVVLNSGFDSGDLNVYMTAYRPAGTDIYVYYKILNRDDIQKFEDSEWQLAIKIQNSDALYSQYRSDLHEYIFAPGDINQQSSLYNGQGYVNYRSSATNQTYNTFNQFAIKVVLVSSDPTLVPYLSDLRCIALPANSGAAA